MVLNPETSEYDPLKLSYGTYMASLWRPSTLKRADKKVADAVDLVMSEDGLMARIHVRVALTQRFKLTPLEQLGAERSS
jgi:hypothetical protein